MKKKLLLTLATLVMMLCVISITGITSNADSNRGSCGTNVTWILDENGVLTISGTGDMTIYDSYTNVPWYSAKDSITSAVIEDGVTSLAKYTFFECTNLTSVKIADSVTKIERAAFRGCSALTEVELPANLTSLGNYVFYQCSNLKSITIPEGVTAIGEYAFYSCYRLECIDLPKGIISIGTYAFSHCSSLSEICIPNSVTTISNDAFEYCIGIKNVVFEDDSKLVTIGDDAFSYCRSLKTIKIPCRVTTIGISSFYDCNNLSTVLFLEGSRLTQIAPYAFYNCEKLKTIEIPASVTSIGYYTFAYCYQLSEVTFEENSKLKSISFNAFVNCDYLKTITIPKNVTTIGTYAFYDCGTLTEVIFEENSKLTTIEYSTFQDCPQLKTIVIPKNVTKIRYNAFLNCYSLENLIFEEDSKISNIEYNAFRNCMALKTITLPTSLKTIGENAFYNCSALTDIFVKADYLAGNFDENWNANCTATVHIGSRLSPSADCHTHTCMDPECSIAEEHIYNTKGYCIVCGLNPQLETGFYTENDKLYYKFNGEIVSGWFETDGVRYYASTATNVVINYDKKIGGKQYFWQEGSGLVLADGFVFDGIGYKCYEDGVNVIGWHHADGSGPNVVDGIYEQYSSNPEGLYYFLSTTGYMVTSKTYKLGGYIREFNEDHTVKVLDGLQNHYGTLYYYIDGVRQVGWHEIDGNKYYFQASANALREAATKWMYIGNQIYYFYASTSATPYALKTSGAIGGITYNYHEDGYIIYNGFVNCDYANVVNSNTAANIQKKNGTTRYYVDGVMQTGWQEINGKWYYFYAIGSSNGSGYMCTQSRTIGGVYYEFASNGVCLSK